MHRSSYLDLFDGKSIWYRFVFFVDWNIRLIYFGLQPEGELMVSSIETSSGRTWVATTTNYFNLNATLKKRKRKERSEDMHAHMNARMRTHTRARMHAQTHKHTRAHTCTRTHKHTQTNSLERTNAHKQRHAWSLNAKRMASKWISLMMEEKQKKHNPCKLWFSFPEPHWAWRHWWFSGRILACHAGGPGSIPGQCIRKFLFLSFFFFFKFFLLRFHCSYLAAVETTRILVLVISLFQMDTSSLICSSCC